MTTALMREAAPVSTAEALHSHFLEIMPRVETHARIFFRYLRCPGRRDDAVAETVAVAWKWYLSASRRGKDLRGFPAALASLAARHVRSGRRLCGRERANDAMSDSAQRAGGFVTHSFFDGGTLAGVIGEALRDNTRTPVPDQAHFRVEVPPWLASLGESKRRVAAELMAGGTTGEVAARHGLSPGRISQMRAELKDDWARLQGGRAFA